MESLAYFIVIKILYYCLGVVKVVFMGSYMNKQLFNKFSFELIVEYVYEIYNIKYDTSHHRLLDI